MSHPIFAHDYGEQTVPGDHACDHDEIELLDELEPGWGLWGCANCGAEWQGSTWEFQQDAADFERKAAGQHGSTR